MTPYPQGPTEVLDYKFDLANTRNLGDTKDYLAAGETIAAIESTSVTGGMNIHDGSTVFNGETKPAPALTDTDSSVVLWLSGGTLTDKYIVKVRLRTSDGRVTSRLLTIEIVDR